MTEETLGHRVKKGYLWTLLGTGVSQPLTFLIGVALARILDLADFGIATACLIFTEVASTLVSSSYVSTLLQRRVLSDLELSTAFVLISLTGGGTALLLVAFSPVAASLYHNAAVTPVLCALSLNLLLLPFSSMPSVLARRGLDFRLLVGAQTLQTITYGAIGVGMALGGSGVWSLVVARLAGYVLQAGSVTNSGSTAALKRGLDAIGMVGDFCDFFGDGASVRRTALAAQYRTLLWLAFQDGDAQCFALAWEWLSRNSPGELASARVLAMRVLLKWSAMRRAAMRLLSASAAIKHRVQFGGDNSRRSG